MNKKILVGSMLLLTMLTTTACGEWITDWIGPSSSSLKQVVDNSGKAEEEYKEEQSKLPQTDVTKADDLLAFTKYTKTVDLTHITMSNGTQETTLALAGVKLPKNADEAKTKETIKRILAKSVDVVIESTSKTGIRKDPSGFAYAYIRADGVLLNEALVRDGLLDVDVSQKSAEDLNYTILTKAKINAQENGLGIWASSSPTSTPTNTNTGTGAPNNNGGTSPTNPPTNTQTPTNTNNPDPNATPPVGVGSSSDPVSALDSDISVKYVALTSSIDIVSTKDAEVDISDWLVQDATGKAGIAIPLNTILKAKGTYSIRLGKPDPTINLLTWDHTIDSPYTRIELYNANNKMVTHVN